MREHVPTVTMVMSEPETVQIRGEFDVKVTVRPDVEVGATVNCVADHARSDGDVNVIDWLALTSEIVWLVPTRLPDEYETVNVPGVPVMPRPVKLAVPPDADTDIDVLDVPGTVPADNVAVI